MPRNAPAVVAKREALRMGIEHLTVLCPTEVSSFDFQVECTDRTMQYKLNVQSLRLFGLHWDVNDAHRAGANRLQNKNKRADDPGFRLKRLRSRTRPCCATFLLRPLPNAHSISRGTGIGGSNNWSPAESPQALQEVPQTRETHQFFTCAVPQRPTGKVVFTDERVNGEECAQATALLEAKKGAVSANYLPDASRQALCTQSVLKGPLETPEPHFRGRASILHTIELITETCHDARLYFLCMGL